VIPGTTPTPTDDADLRARLERARSEAQRTEEIASAAEANARLLRETARSARHRYDNLLLELQGQLTIDSEDVT
jgi:hypothetical protein